MEHTNTNKTDTFRFRINPELKEKVEDVYQKSGLTLTQAINIFINQSINAGGLPFPVTESNGEYMKAQAMKKLLAELEAGKQSGAPLDEADALKMLGVEL